MSIQEILNDRRDEIRDAAIQHGARNVRIFGSAVRGQAGSDSDLDLLVEMEPGRTLLDVIAIEQDLEDLLGRKVDVLTEAAISPCMGSCAQSGDPLVKDESPVSAIRALRAVETVVGEC
jgi:predicted nucleotidyltransferase